MHKSMLVNTSMDLCNDFFITDKRTSQFDRAVQWHCAKSEEAHF